MKEKISIIGAGSWGTTLAVYLSKKGVEVKLHSVFKEHNLQMKKRRKNELFLKNVKFPSLLSVETSLKKALDEEIILIAIPVKFIRKVLKKVARQGVNLEDKIFVSVSKGIEVKSLKRVSEIIEKELDASHIGVLSGPTIAKEVAKGIPTTAVIASEEEPVGKKLQELFNSQTFRIYLHNDVTGVELAGALKNIIALACGISDGLGFGTNTKSALVTRGLVEIARIGEKLGAQPQTFWGISGLGDLITTCFSPYSRNRTVGEFIGKGKNLKNIIEKMDMVAEGVETVKSAYKMTKELEVNMPIVEQVYKVLYKNKSAYRAVTDLMSRPAKREKIN
ncbi:MAG: NAD(P)-dependent glycerol-3-phosphate dehydrogenase [Candidatus Omnitrophica bacterium]|nr:NAD(P)-dependent glycerol-3-phosphate dehydrogenase [Candidatus Omnitrophota bacterium]MCF7877157.1 NAD(P)-dependent glycerol-3-phosphate dehydrogenase [Candidatus Omnitrophota bacterium]MCF7878404.1 NAD(P)-dependent glycerol-3-phosphate dehydrogenase [Candidatus Omnitrophota bacterium]MCF7893410.1 NAD(P)-dependent glycerol-3-phosphate dehydrogenase [Candidatus Omnitrophota bacterium]